MQEQLEKINKQAKVLIGEIEKYKSAASINKESAKGFIVAAGALKTLSGKIRPLTGMGFLRLQYVAIALAIVNLMFAGIIIYLLNRL